MLEHPRVAGAQRPRIRLPVALHRRTFITKVHLRQGLLELARNERIYDPLTLKILRRAGYVRADGVATEAGKAEIRGSVERRVKTATDQIEAAEAAAIRQIRDRAVSVAVAAAAELIRSRLSEQDATALVDRSIGEVGAKLH